MEKNLKKTSRSSSSPDSASRTSISSAGPQILRSPGRSLTSWKDFDGSVELTNLNRNLGQYIELVKKLEDEHKGGLQSTGKTTINVNIDRSQVFVIQEKYQQGLKDLQDICSENDKTIAKLLVEIYKLESEKKQLSKSNSNKEAAIGELDLTIGQLEAEIGRLKTSLSFHQNQKGIFEIQVKALEKEIVDLNIQIGETITKLNKKKLTNAERASELFRLDKHLRFEISVKSRELMAERTKSNIDWEEIRTQKGERYKIWMDGELRVLQDTYQQQMDDVKLTLENMYKEKETSLTVSLAKAKEEADKPDEEGSKMKVELETMKLKLGELEANNQHLSVKHVQISTELENKRTVFTTQLSAKDRELARMKAEHDAIKAKYEEMLKGINREQVEIYSNTLTPEIRRISGRFGTQQVVSSGKTLNFSRTSSSSKVRSMSSVNGVNGVFDVKK